MAYCTLSTGKWHCYKSENEKLSKLERRNPKNWLFIVNGLRTYSYQDIKLKGVDSCIAEIKRMIQDGQFGKVYREAFGEIDQQYFTENDYDLLASYFDQFMKEVYRILNPKIDIPINVSNSSKKDDLNKKQINLKKQIEAMQKELEAAKKESEKIDISDIDSDINEGNSIPTDVPKVPID